MDLRPRVTKLKNLNVNLALQDARAEGISAYVLSGTGITDRESLFEAVRMSLPLDPPLVGSKSWDAMSDSLWSGLDALTSGRIIIIWTNSSAMEQLAPRDFELALKVFEDVAQSLADPVATNGEPKEVRVLVG